MHRLFVAIRPPRAIRERLLDLMEGISGARWQEEDQLHLTLRFIGETDRHLAQDVAAALRTVHHGRFDLALSGVGSFDRRGRPVTLWAGVTPHEPLRSLHRKIDQLLVRTGLAPDRRAYFPHITLARLKRDTGPIENLMANVGTLGGGPFEVDAFSLYESELTPAGAFYSIVERYPLH